MSEIRPYGTTDDATATAVGWIAIEAAEIELVTAQLSAALTGSGRAQHLTVGQPWRTIVDGLLATLSAPWYISLTPTDLAHLDRIRADAHTAERLMVERNRVVHAIWDEPTADGYRASSRFQRFGSVSGRAWSLDQLATLRDDLHRVSNDLWEHLIWAIDLLNDV
ncbi:hypothetical protein SAMN05443575_1340 [Jatrophihabitans endophyticus]|uniref:Uncharacterized protein n=1 Tax=Jatrophihabitans endophyticus TaxID=1206085 RepID=A0A1M5GZB2_9ACTN|nr:hypothetical protein [Jatrophihabitans endophyticus]SHG09017.1 hypothetical protein SAMN05443575_1340 [Jatrophihabitans endophyticus]